MLSARSPLSVRDENKLSSQVNNMSLDKENTVRRKPPLTDFSSSFKLGFNINLFLPSASSLVSGRFNDLRSFIFQPPSLNTTRILASKTARKIFDDASVSD